MEKDLNQKQEDFFAQESQEVTIGESPLIEKFLSAFPALKHRNYQLYFGGQLISLTGTWLQMIAQGWLVLQLTHSAFLVGVVSAAGNLPTLLFSLFGGVIVDRFPKKKILILTQISSMLLAFALGILTVLNLINVYQIIILSFLLGVVNAIDTPARQTFVIHMVGKEDLSSAIALNSGVFNGARVVGPGIAGIIIAVAGTGGAFLLNAVSYLAVIAALVLINVYEVMSKMNSNTIKSIKEGVSFAFSSPSIRTLLIFAGFASIFGWSYSTIMPVIVQDVFHKGAESLGYFYSASGLGAVLGIILVFSLSKKIKNTVFIIGGNLLFAVSTILFSFTNVELIAFLFLFAAGFGLLSMFAMINTTIQHNVPDQLRGRVMSIYTLMFIGMFPFGSFQVGFIADKFGPGFAIRLGACVMLILCFYLYLNRKKIEGKY